MADKELLTIRNASRQGAILANQARRASSFVDRFVGLMGVRDFPLGRGLLFERCNSIHTFFMRLPIDVAFLDASRKVVHIYAALPPWRISGVHFSARSVLELPAGVLVASNTQVGDVLEF